MYLNRPLNYEYFTLKQVNNAGIFVSKEATETTSEDYSLIMGTNVEASYNLSQLAYPLLKASGNGSIVFLSSAAGIASMPCSSIYATSKGINSIFIFLKKKFKL